MEAIKMSNSAYNEFKTLLEENSIEDYRVRINLAGMGCSGPAFNIVIDQERENDLIVKIEDITFLISKDLIEQFDGFEITSTEENGKGLMLLPLKNFGTNCCSGCSGCGH